jgi:hypothetical protein
MRRDITLVCAFGARDDARRIARLLAAEDWRVDIANASTVDAALERQRDGLVLMLATADAADCPYVAAWLAQTPADRLAVLAFDAPEALGPSFAAGESVMFDFVGWRGDRAQLWRMLTRWLDAPHARLDTRVWLKRA